MFFRGIWSRNPMWRRRRLFVKMDRMVSFGSPTANTAEKNMGIARSATLVGLAAILALTLARTGLTAPVPDVDEAALQKKALALNDVTGDDPILGEIKALVDDATGTRKLLPVAVRMAKQKDQPFSYNGAYILGAAALQLSAQAPAGKALPANELDASQTFFFICLEQAVKLRSDAKFAKAMRGLGAVIALLELRGEFAKEAHLAQKQLEFLDKEGVKGGARNNVYRRWIWAQAKEGKVAEANKMIDGLLKAGSDWRNHELKARINSEILEHFDAAVADYEQVLKTLGKDDDLDKDEKAEMTAETRLKIVENLYLAKKYDQSGDQAQELLDSLERQGAGKSSRDEVLRRLIQARARAGKLDEANRLVNKRFQGKADNLDELNQRALLYTLVENYAGAAKAYEELLVKLPKDSDLDSERKALLEDEFRYFLSGIYIDLNQVDKATAQLRMLLTHKPNDPTYNNDLGYIWADHDMKLNEAEAMIRKALDEDRKRRKEDKPAKTRPGAAAADQDNAAYLDSLGWVLYKKKNYKEALKYLQQAVQYKEGQHIEIMDHLADAHLALGQKAEAITVWNKALTLEAPTKRERERRTQVEKKLKANQ
jgi:Flp pilus assembly protein TadD